MEFTLSSTALSSRLQTLAKVISGKNSLPILDSFLFNVNNGQLTLTTSDSENMMQTSLALDSQEGEGSFALQSQTILDAMRELPEQPLRFSVDLALATITISYQGGEYNFTTLNADEYPRMQPMPENVNVVTIDAGVLASSLNRSIFATAQDELRPVMNGIYFDLTPDALAIVASDGHKLVRNNNFAINSETPASFILPKKPANLLKNILGKDGGDVVIKFDERNAEIHFADGLLVCRLIEGRYPNYNSVIPQSNPNQLTIDRRLLLSALRRVLPFGSKSSQLVKFKLAAGSLELSSEDIDYATKAHETLACDYAGQNMSIGFKGSSLTEILSNLDGDQVNIELADPSRAGIIVPVEQPENEDVLMLLMPMLLSDQN